MCDTGMAALKGPPNIMGMCHATSFCELSAAVKYLNALAVTPVRTNCLPSNAMRDAAGSR